MNLDVLRLWLSDRIYWYFNEGNGKRKKRLYQVQYFSPDGCERFCFCRGVYSVFAFSGYLYACCLAFAYSEPGENARVRRMKEGGLRDV